MTDNLMVLDTEYDTFPKRLLAISYVVNKKQIVNYVKHDPNVFQVNEEGDAFKVHKLSNNFLQENGLSVGQVLENFSNELDNIDTIMGHNVIAADLDVIRREAIGEKMWFGKIREKLKKIKIHDTMESFRDKHPGEKASLDNVYSFLLDEQMLDHHNPLADCLNTLKCYKKMFSTEFKFDNLELKFGEDKFDRLKGEKRSCRICETSILMNEISYQFITDSYNGNFIINNFLEKDDIVCSKCFTYFEIQRNTNKSDFLDIIKIKNSKEIDKFFKILGDNKVKIYLISKFKDKDEIKKLGGRWDNDKKSWYIIISLDNKKKLNSLKKWLPDDIEI